MSDAAPESATRSGASEAGPTVVPSFPRIRRIDDLWYRGEKAVCGALFLLMALIVFMSVLRDVFGTRHEWIDAVVLFVLVWGGASTRAVKPGEKKRTLVANLIIALVLTAVVVAAVELYLRAFPGGFMWGPKLALCLMLWVAFLGASMTTYEKAHLALEAGDKIWPVKIRRYVKAFAYALTSGFCILLLVLSIGSIIHHYTAWDVASGEADTVPTLDWLPMWAVFLIFPYLFIAMAVRIMAQAVTIAHGSDVAFEGGEAK